MYKSVVTSKAYLSIVPQCNKLSCSTTVATTFILPVHTGRQGHNNEIVPSIVKENRQNKVRVILNILPVHIESSINAMQHATVLQY